MRPLYNLLHAPTAQKPRKVRDHGSKSTTTTNNNNIELNTQSSKMPDYCTVYQAELSAITNAATALTAIIANKKNTVFFTDSQYSIEALVKITIYEQQNHPQMPQRYATPFKINTLSETNIVHVKGKAGGRGPGAGGQVFLESSSVLG